MIITRTPGDIAYLSPMIANQSNSLVFVYEIEFLEGKNVKEMSFDWFNNFLCFAVKKIFGGMTIFGQIFYEFLYGRCIS